MHKLCRLVYACILGCTFLFSLFLQGCLSSPTVVGLALPAVIKIDEGKLAKHPDDEALRLQTGSYYVMYANAFVQGPAEMLPSSKFDKREANLSKAKKLYTRGAEILGQGLEKKYPGILKTKKDGIEKYTAQFTKNDVPTIYWYVAGNLSAYALDPFNMSIGIQIPKFDAMIKRAYEIDPNYNDGALDDFFIIFYGSLPESLGGNIMLAKKHFDLAVKKSQGMSASPFVSYAETIAIPAQDYSAFKSNLERALAVNISDIKGSFNRLAQKISQRRARYLLENAENYFITIQE